ncbi:MAG: ankyrin repeat domain-containing protein [Gemmatimonadetes bacterium]|nr:ankyrin repeat domain-containing protein [Gemmatimonadota bacterium]
MIGLRALVAAAGFVLFTTASLPVTPLADAAMRRDAATVRALVARGADVNAAQGDGMTALHWAARFNQVEVANLLLRARANVSAATRIGGYTPLHVAAENGAGEVVALLVKAGANPNAAGSVGVTPLHLAALYGDARAVKALLDAKATVDAREPQWGQTPLMIAAAKGRLEAVKLLLAAGADHKVAAKAMDVMASAAIDRQSKQRRNQVLAEAREQEGAKDKAGWQPKPSVVQKAVQAAMQVDNQVATAAALDGAAQARAAEEQRLMAQGGPGLDDDAPGYTELIGAQGGLTSMLLAVREGHVPVVKALVEAGADINQVSAGDKSSPLLMATINGHYDLALELIKAGANPNLYSDAGAGPLYAVLNKEWAPTTRTPQPAFQLRQSSTYLDVVAALLKAGANPNARLKRSLWYTTYNRDNLRVDFAGATPLFRAAYATDVEAMKLLVAAGADPAVATIRPAPRARRGDPAASATGAMPAAPRTDPSGLPAVPDGGPGVYLLHAAAGVGYGQGFAANDHRHVPDGWLPAVKYIVEVLGADVNARDYSGYTAVHHAASRGDNEMIKYLVSKGADVTAVSRSGQTTADMANGPVQRINPYPETVQLLMSLGSKNNNKCVSC